MRFRPRSGGGRSGGGRSMRWLSSSLTPVRFAGAEAAAYAGRAASRDLLVVRAATTLILISQISRLVVEWSFAPDAIGAGALNRIAGFPFVMLVLAATWVPWLGRRLHAVVALGFLANVHFIARSHAEIPLDQAVVPVGLWLLPVLVAACSFNRRFVAMAIGLGLALPVVVAAAGVRFASWTPVIGVFALVTALALAISWTLECHWRRSFRMELDLARSNTALRRTNEELFRAYATLKDTQAQLIRAEKAAALSHLVANVAHQVNTPVGNMLAVGSHLAESAERLGRMAASGPVRRSEFQRFVTTVGDAGGVVVANAKRTAELVQAFQRLAVDSGDTSTVVDLGEVLERWRPQFDPMIAPGVRLTVAAEPGLAVRGPVHAIETVLQELVCNAVRHGFPDGATGSVTLEARRAADGAVELRAGDDGCGIGAEHLEHVFDPFYTDGRVGGSHGLGLALVHNAVVGPLRGTIAIDSGRGRGTVLTIRLPSASQPSSSASASTMRRATS